MSHNLKMIALLTIASILLVGCKKEAGVGDAFQSFDPKEAEAARRLGEAAKVSQDPNAAPSTAAIQNKPSPQPTGQAPKPTQTLTLSLVHDSPYFELDGIETNEISVSVNTQLKIVNNDDRPRSFVVPGLAYDSEKLDPGQGATFNATTKGVFQVEDAYAPFVSANLRVT